MEATQWGEAKAKLLTSVTQFAGDLALLQREVEEVCQLLEAGQTEAAGLEKEMAQAEASLAAVEAREAELASAHLILLEQKERLTKELAAELSRVEELRCKAKKMDRRKTDRKMIQEDLMVAKERYVKQQMLAV